MQNMAPSPARWITGILIRGEIRMFLEAPYEEGDNLFPDSQGVTPWLQLSKRRPDQEKTLKGLSKSTVDRINKNSTAKLGPGSTVYLNLQIHYDHAPVNHFKNSEKRRGS